MRLPVTALLVWAGLAAGQIPAPSELSVEVGKPAAFNLDFDSPVYWVAASDPALADGTFDNANPKSVAVTLTGKKAGTGFLVFGMRESGQLIKVTVTDPSAPAPSPGPRPIPPLNGRSAGKPIPKAAVQEFDGKDARLQRVLGTVVRARYGDSWREVPVRQFLADGGPVDDLVHSGVDPADVEFIRRQRAAVYVVPAGLDAQIQTLKAAQQGR